MKKVMNNQRHPVTPAGDVPAIPAYGQGVIDELLPENAALIDDGIVSVLLEEPVTSDDVASSEENKPAAASDGQDTGDAGEGPARPHRHRARTRAHDDKQEVSK